MRRVPGGEGAPRSGSRGPTSPRLRRRRRGGNMRAPPLGPGRPEMNRFLVQVATAAGLASGSAAAAQDAIRQPWRCEPPGFLDGMAVSAGGVTLDGFSLRETDSF